MKNKFDLIIKCLYCNEFFIQFENCLIIFSNRYKSLIQKKYHLFEDHMIIQVGFEDLDLRFGNLKKIIDLLIISILIFISRFVKLSVSSD